ncbi:MAG: hypothetical protein EBU90_22700 [Proteobacteria bacterium]|nr:hypothetical protein [Pseudomonadota bacterium]
MKKLLIVWLCAGLFGCSTVVPIKPKKQEFPQPIPQLMVPCPDLSLVPKDTTKLSDTIVVISDNYALYHECRAKLDSWIEWYNEQKKIYNSVN